MNNEEVKVCSKCKKEYPKTNEFFSKKGNGLRSICKVCDNKLRKERDLKQMEDHVRIKISLKPKENQAFLKKAEELGMSKRELFEFLILKAQSTPIIKIEKECFSSFNHSIRAIGKSINYIAHRCNRNVNVTKQDIKELQEEIDKIKEWQIKLEEEFKMIHKSIAVFGKALTNDEI